jgi:hypothetical protein
MIPAGTYLLFGRTGVGKSSLVNSLAQFPVATINNSFACTQEITAHSFSTPSGEYLIYDTPGLCEDEDPITDDKYIMNIINFLYAQEDKSSITILFVVRAGSTRLRSEDWEVVSGLANILYIHPLPVSFVASNISFSSYSQDTRQDFRRLRMQFLVALDSEMILLSQRERGINGFLASYGVDSVNGIWFEDFGDTRIILESCDVATLEGSLGHKYRDLCIWIYRSGHDPSVILGSQHFYLFAARILNLSLSVTADAFTLIDFLSVDSKQVLEVKASDLVSRFVLYKPVAPSQLLEEYEDDYNLLPSERTIEILFAPGSTGVEISVSAISVRHIPLNVAESISGIRLGLHTFQSAMQVYALLVIRGFSRKRPSLSQGYERVGMVSGGYSEYEQSGADDWVDESDRDVDYGYRDDDDYYE